MRSLFLIIFSAIVFFSCKGKNSTPPTPQQSAEEKIKANIHELANTAMPGDLVVRLTDDLISYQVKAINEKDRSYSHAGVVVELNHQKFLAHISPETPGYDTIQYTPIDSFLDPAKTINCALYRYELSPKERDSLGIFIAALKAKGVKFDRLYNLKTDTTMYCSEMISKALKSITNNRITCKESTIPKQMQHLLVAYFKKEKASDKIIAERKIMTIDNLYLRPDCKLLMQLPLKTFQ